ncbi:hypothetical protein B4135_3489 [Caldibacillus debilis]|uniref:Uncharacterized protein n=1 Tax=Caldibacillus debilis TaxID=301148 RepID=A0A150LDH6_9BACI|nr:hypothetical protein B4135_3489 [Caldibacillus debilis]
MIFQRKGVPPKNAALLFCLLLAGMRQPSLSRGAASRCGFPPAVVPPIRLCQRRMRTANRFLRSVEKESYFKTKADLFLDKSASRGR